MSSSSHYHDCHHGYRHHSRHHHHLLGTDLLTLHCVNIFAGILFSEGEKWKDMRKFTVVTLRDFGVGKKSLEEKIQDETQVVMNVLEKSEKPIFPRRLFCNATSNMICSVIFGERCVNYLFFL